MSVLLLPRIRPRGTAYALGLAGAAHVAIALAVPRSAIANIKPAPTPTELVEVQLPPPERPVQAPQEEPKQAAPVPKRAEAAPPPPAQAAKVLTQREDPTAPADFTNSIVVGNAETYAGGTSASNGLTARAVAVVGTGSPASTATAKASVAGPDLSKRARLAEGGSWSCPFPEEADSAQVDHAVVGLRIAVSSSGAATEIQVTQDPGNGFGREARACARSKRYATALDRDGLAVPGTILVNVRFDR
jgi:periplasmic protein TonB